MVCLTTANTYPTQILCKVLKDRKFTGTSLQLFRSATTKGFTSCKKCPHQTYPTYEVIIAIDSEESCVKDINNVRDQRGEDRVKIFKHMTTVDAHAMIHQPPLWRQQSEEEEHDTTFKLCIPGQTPIQVSTV
jgi:hypothetical protein